MVVLALLEALTLCPIAVSEDGDLNDYLQFSLVKSKIF